MGCMGCEEHWGQRALPGPKESREPQQHERSERALIDVIADSGACATVMPKHICGNIRLRESAGSKSGVEYEVASGKAVPTFW